MPLWRRGLAGCPSQTSGTSEAPLAPRMAAQVPRVGRRQASSSAPPLGRAARVRAEEEAHTQRRVAEVGASLGAALGGTPAAVRLEALRLRVAARLRPAVGAEPEPTG